MRRNEEIRENKEERRRWIRNGRNEEEGGGEGR